MDVPYKKFDPKYYYGDNRQNNDCIEKYIT